MAEHPRIFAIPASTNPQAKFTAKFASVNRLAAFSYKHVTYKSKDAPPSSPESAIISLIQPHNIIFEPCLRKLVNESYGIYTAVHEIAKTERETLEMRKKLLKMSQNYRSIIRATLEDLKFRIEKAVSDDTSKHSSFLTVFYSIECVWHLVEILFVDAHPGDTILRDLLEWTRFHFPKHERNATTVLNSSLLSGAEAHSEYWNTVIGVLMQGEVQTARALLRFHSASDSSPFQTATQCLKTMPIFDMYDGSTINDFNIKWSQWLTDVKTKIDAMAFHAHEPLETLMKLVIGDARTWEGEGMRRCNAWYEYMTCKLLFTNPTVKLGQLPTYARKCFDEWRGSKRQLDRIVCVVLNQDVVDIVKHVQELSDGGWFAAHLTNLMFYANVFNVHANDEQRWIALHDSLLFDYGTLLMSHNSLWQIGADYVASCASAETPARLRLLLESISLKTEYQTCKVLQIAKKYRLNDTYMSVCKQRAMIALKRQKVGDALVWALKSRDTYLLSQMADKLLMEYCDTGNLSLIDLLSNLGSSVLLSDRLVFLTKYCEFHKLYESGQVQVAAALVVSLLQSKIVPNYFWNSLLVDSLALLENERALFSTNETYEILHCIEKYASTAGLDADKLKILRIAAGKNLARAILKQNQTRDK